MNSLKNAALSGIVGANEERRLAQIKVNLFKPFETANRDRSYAWHMKLKVRADV